MPSPEHCKHNWEPMYGVITVDGRKHVHTHFCDWCWQYKWEESNEVSVADEQDQTGDDPIADALVRELQESRDRAIENTQSAAHLEDTSGCFAFVPRA